MTRKVILFCYLASEQVATAKTSENEHVSAICAVLAALLIGVAAHFALAPSKSGEDKS